MIRGRRLLSQHGAERLTACILALIAAGVLAESLRLELSRGVQPGPGFFPALVAGILLVLSSLWAVQGARMPASGDSLGLLKDATFPEPGDQEGSTTPEELTDRSVNARQAKILAFAVLWALVPILLLTAIGFTLTMTVYVSGLLLIVGRTSRVWTVPLTFVGTVLVGIGARVVGIYLPEPTDYLTLLGL